MKNMKEKLGAKLKKKNGFTLIEMLVVIAIIVILVLVSIPLVNSSLDKAKEATDKANIRAAKAVAAIEYLNDSKAGKYVYDADAGELVDQTKTFKYGQLGKHDYIKVEIASDGKIKCEWNTKNEGESTTTPSGGTTSDVTP